MKESIIELANKICLIDFMTYPDYDKEEPIDNLPDALTVLIMENTEDLISAEVYDYINEIIKS